jgi:hypothetical protein
MKQEDQEKKMQQIIMKAQSDINFKKRLMTDPAVVLGEGGIDIPSDVEVRALENTDKVWHFVLPPSLNAELSNEQLDAVAGGCMCTACSMWSASKAR